jgi:MFS family permease
VTGAVDSILGPRLRGLSFGIVGIVSVVAFEAMAVATAMPIAVRDLHGLAAYGWAFSGYLVASLFATVVAGELADSRGPTIPLLGGLGIFVVGLVVAGTAVDMAVFVLGRLLQGLGAGGMIVAVYVVVGAVYDESLRPRMFSVLSAAWVLPALIGPPIAGVLAQHASWRLVFLLVPLLAIPAAAVMAPRVIRIGAEPREEHGWQRVGRKRAALAVACGAAALQSAGTAADLWSVPLAALGIGLLAVSLPRLLPAGALRLARGLPATVVMRGALSGPFFGAEAFIPLLLVSQRGLSPGLAGLTLTGGALGWSAGSWAQGRPKVRTARESLVGRGALLVAIGILIVSTTVRHEVPVAVAGLGWVVAGLGMGLGMASISVVSLSLAPPADRGATSAALQLCDFLGSTLTISLGSACYALGGGRKIVFLVIFLTMAGLAALTASAARRMRPPGGRHTDAAPGSWVEGRVAT